MIDRHFLFLILLCIAQFAAAEDANPSPVGYRALAFQWNWSTHSEDSEWTTKFGKDYLHPEANDSGLPGRLPGFLEPLKTPQSQIFLVSGVHVGRVKEGSSKWVLNKEQSIYGVELVFQAIGVVNDGVQYFDKPQEFRSYLLLGLDPTDQKWKVIESFPYATLFYEASYFFQVWPKIVDKNLVKNLPEAKAQLEKSGYRPDPPKF